MNDDDLISGYLKSRLDARGIEALGLRLAADRAFADRLAMSLWLEDALAASPPWAKALRVDAEIASSRPRPAPMTQALIAASLLVGIIGLVAGLSALPTRSPAPAEAPAKAAPGPSQRTTSPAPLPVHADLTETMRWSPAPDAAFDRASTARSTQVATWTCDLLSQAPDIEAGRMAADGVSAEEVHYSDGIPRLTTVFLGPTGPGAWMWDGRTSLRLRIQGSVAGQRLQVLLVLATADGRNYAGNLLAELPGLEQTGWQEIEIPPRCWQAAKPGQPQGDRQQIQKLIIEQVRAPAPFRVSGIAAYPTSSAPGAP